MSHSSSNKNGFMSSPFMSCLIRYAPFLQELALLSCICYTILGDEYLSRYACLVLFTCCLFLFTCCLVIFSSAAVPRPKSSAKDKPFEHLVDSDLEFENEYQIVRLEQMNCVSDIFKNSYEFMKFRPVYGLLVGVGVIFLVAFFSLRAFLYQNVQKDLHFASSLLIAPGIFLVATPVFIANAEVYFQDSENAVVSYRPFQMQAKVPMKTMVFKTLVCLVAVGYNNVISTLLVLASTLLSIFCFVFVYTMTIEDIKEMEDKYQMRLLYFENVRGIVASLLLVATVLGILVLRGKIWCSWKIAKSNLFGIIEKNWRWNLRAVENLLPDVVVRELEDLQADIETKRNQQLTDGEKLALKYLEKPLWQTRLPFVFKVRRLNVEDVQPAARKIPKSPHKDDSGRQSKMTEPLELGGVEQGTRNEQEPAMNENDQQLPLGEVVQPQSDIVDEQREHVQRAGPREIVQWSLVKVHEIRAALEETVQYIIKIVFRNEKYGRASAEVTSKLSDVVDEHKEHDQAELQKTVQPPSDIVDEHREHDQAAAQETAQSPSNIVDEHLEHDQAAAQETVQPPSGIVDEHREHHLQAAAQETVQSPVDIVVDEERQDSHAPVEF